MTVSDRTHEKTVPEEIAYLETNYDAFRMGVEKDRPGMAVLAIKAFRLARSTDEKEKVVQLAEDGKMLVDWLMKRYTEAKASRMLPDFVKRLRGA